MITLEQAKTLSLHDLLVYRDALEALASNYEKDVLPLYGMASLFDKQDPQQMQARQKLDIVNSHLRIIYEAMEFVTLNMLEKIKIKEDKSKKPMLLVENKKTSKKNVKKNNKKD